jgi:hypothetical protein
MAFRFNSGLIFSVFVSLAYTSSCLGQTSQQTSSAGRQRRAAVSPADQLSRHPLPGTISGTIMDQSGALVSGARVKLAAEDAAFNQEVQSGSDGQFSFTNIAPGPFELTITSPGFSAQKVSGVLHSGEIMKLPPIALNIPTAVTEVQVGLPQTEVAEEQIKIEEKQRVLGVIPNFYVSYVHNAAPLDSKQKFELAWKTVLDPVTFVVVAGLAGVQQAQNHFVGYGQGAQGYAKRFGADYADTVTATFVGGFLLPSLLKQDPRYFYKGTGSTASRFLYAIGNSVICKGDNRRWQPNYSNILGNLAAGGVSNLYYPSQDRNGAELTFENAAVGIGAGAITNVLQEFVIPRLTPAISKRNGSKP